MPNANEVLVGRYVTLTEDARAEIYEATGVPTRNVAHKVYDRRGAVYVIVPVERDLNDSRREVLDHANSLKVWDDQVTVIPAGHFHGQR